MLGRKGWKIKEREVEVALETAEGIDAEIGELILERLRTYGEFYDRLSNDRDLDAEIARRQAEPSEPGTPAVAASCALGSLTLTARTPGGAGNSIVATVSPGTAAGFTVQGIDSAQSQALLNSTIDALNGIAPALSTIPEIAAAQQLAADFLAQLDAATRSNAEKMIRENWDRYRVARTESDLEYDRNRALAPLNTNLSSVASETGQAMAAMVATAPDDQAALMTAHLSQPVEGAFNGTLSDLESSDYDATSLAQYPEGANVPSSIEDAYEGMIEREREAVASVFTLAITNGVTTETFNDIVSGFNYSFEGSLLVSAGVWNGTTRPADGDYPFTQGADASASRSGLVGLKPDSSYILNLDANRHFTLPEVEEIVVNTIAAADRWLS